MAESFYNRRLRPKKEGERYSPLQLTRSLDVLKRAEYAWQSLSTVRKKAARAQMYGFEDQWGDVVKDPDSGKSMTEGEYIKKQGKMPLKNNVIRPILKNVEGQFRNNTTKPVCVVRDKDEAKIGEMMSVAIEYIHQINECQEVDAASLLNLMLAGVCAQRVEFGFNASKQMLDVWTYPCNTNRFFFNTDVEDPRAWDIRIIGELFDMPLADVLAAFPKAGGLTRETIKRVYGELDRYLYYDTNGMQGDQNRDMDFYTPSRANLCRVILVWTKESRDAIFCHDLLKGDWWYEDLGNKKRVEAENARRIRDGLAAGMEREDILTIEMEEAVEQYWYFRYMAPDGSVLFEGRSPYWHKQHNYAINMYTLVNGKIFNFVDDFIDQQRYINRTITLIDFIRSSSAKGLLVCDETALDGMRKEDIVDEYVRTNGVVYVRLKPGQRVNDVIQQYSGTTAVSGDFELLNLQLKLINDIAGVNSAMQGQVPKAGTPSALYAQQAQNASINIKGLMDSMKNFLRKRDTLIMKTTQQYYTSRKYIDLAGSDYSAESKMYDPNKVRNAEIDVYIAEGSNTPVYQMVVNDFLMELFKAQAINVKQFLENSSLPFATRILESIKRDEAEIQAAQEQGRLANPQGVPPEVMGQMQGAVPQQAVQM